MTQPNQPEQPQRWYFTWGYRQHLPDGAKADGCYTTVTGTHDSTRDEMFARFGQVWSWQYDELVGAQIARDYNMTLVDASLYPKRFEADGITPLIVAEALKALAPFTIADRAAAAALLSIWARRTELTRDDLRAVLAHFDEVADRCTECPPDFDCQRDGAPGGDPR